MSQTIDEYRCKLINKILFARSQYEVKRYIDTAMKNLKQHKVNGHIIARFIEKSTIHLQEFNPMNHDSQQWANIKMARVKFSQTKELLQGGAQNSGGPETK